MELVRGGMVMLLTLEPRFGLLRSRAAWLGVGAEAAAGWAGAGSSCFFFLPKIFMVHSQGMGRRIKMEKGEDTENYN